MKDLEFVKRNELTDETPVKFPIELLIEFPIKLPVKLRVRLSFDTRGCLSLGGLTNTVVLIDSILFK
jgi:hypothetical protein